MSEVTVKQLAESVGTNPDRLLKQMKEAGLEHSSEDASVSEEQKQTLLTHLKRSHGEAEGAPRKITLKRKTVSTLKAGQGKGRAVNVEVRRKRTYVKRGEQAAEAPAAEEQAPKVASQAQAEVERIRSEESARQSAEEETRRRAAERKAEEEQRREEEAARKAQEETDQRAKERQEKQTATPELSIEEQVAQAAVDAQAEEQSAERGGRRDGKDHHKDSADSRFSDGGGRRELSFKSNVRRTKRRGGRVEQHGGEFERPQETKQREIEIPTMITVGDLAQRMTIKAGEVIKTLMGMGVMATINQTLDQDTATLVVEEMGHSVKLISEDALEQALEESLKIEESEGEVRPPVLTVMGHVDHGKTSLLDYIRKTKVASGEAGGITQHIGAYSVAVGDGRFTFLDTPGHSAFTAMRARGAKATDIVILVVAADDGVMPQTEEAVQHAKAAGTPLIVAVNKIDLEGADPERVKNELSALEVIPEDWGGDTQFVNVSAITGEGVDALLESVQLQAEILELKAVEDASGRGVVVESRLDRGRGPVSTVLVQNGTLRQGDTIVAGEHYGRVRAMMSDTGETVKDAGPSTPIEVLGLSGTPDAGDEFSVVSDERKARELVEFRKTRKHDQRLALQQASKLDNMFANMVEGKKRFMNIVLKADVRGSLEAIAQAIAEINTDEVAVNVVGSGVGGITESDATLAQTSQAVMFGFNVRADPSAKQVIEREGVELRYYSVIYELLDDIKQMLSGMLSPEVREKILGVAEVRDIFRSPRYGEIAGCMVIEGTMFRNKKIRVLRDNIVIYEGELESLRRFKDDVNEVRNGLECGIGVRNYSDVREADKIEVFESTEVAREL